MIPIDPLSHRFIFYRALVFIMNNGNESTLFIFGKAIMDKKGMAEIIS
jgi:hypothetical protein